MPPPHTRYNTEQRGEPGDTYLFTGGRGGGEAKDPALMENPVSGRGIYIYGLFWIAKLKKKKKKKIPVCVCVCVCEPLGRKGCAAVPLVVVMWAWLRKEGGKNSTLSRFTEISHNNNNNNKIVFFKNNKKKRAEKNI